jgi:hypothetical protein
MNQRQKLGVRNLAGTVDCGSQSSNVHRPAQIYRRSLLKACEDLCRGKVTRNSPSIGGKPDQIRDMVDADTRIRAR